MPSINSIFTLAVASVLATAVRADFLVAQGISCSTEGQRDCNPTLAVAPWSDFNCNSLINPPATFTQDSTDAFHINAVDGGAFCNVMQLNGDRSCQGCAVFDLFVNGGNGTQVGYCYGVVASQFYGLNPDGSDDEVPTDNCIEGQQDATYSEDLYCVTWGEASSC